MLNLVVVQGILARPASSLELPSGDRLLSLEVTVRPAEGRAEPVPVVWPDPPAWACALDTGAAVALIGRVRRRFFRAGGTTQSRTEVVAARVVRLSARAKLSALMDEAVAVLQRSGDPAPVGAPPGRHLPGGAGRGLHGNE